MTWIQFKESKRKWTSPEWWEISPDEIMSLRDVVEDAMEELFKRDPEDWWFGMVEGAFAHRSLRDADVEIPKGLDGIMLISMSWAPIRIAKGTFESGPKGKWKKFESLIPDHPGRM